MSEKKFVGSKISSFTEILRNLINYLFYYLIKHEISEAGFARVVGTTRLGVIASTVKRVTPQIKTNTKLTEDTAKVKKHFDHCRHHFTLLLKSNLDSNI